MVTTDTDQGVWSSGWPTRRFCPPGHRWHRRTKENASALRARRTVEQAATEWNDEGRPPARLWERGQLAA